MHNPGTLIYILSLCRQLPVRIRHIETHRLSIGKVVLQLRQRLNSADILAQVGKLIHRSRNVSANLDQVLVEPKVNVANAVASDEVLVSHVGG